MLQLRVVFKKLEFQIKDLILLMFLQSRLLEVMEKEQLLKQKYVQNHMKLLLMLQEQLRQFRQVSIHLLLDLRLIISLELVREQNIIHLVKRHQQVLILEQYIMLEQLIIKILNYILHLMVQLLVLVLLDLLIMVRDIIL